MSSPPQMPKLSRSQRRDQQLQELFTALTAEVAQLKRTLWLVLRTTGSPTVTIDQLDMSPLWDLKFTAPEGEPTKLTLTAELLPAPTDEQLDALAELLLGTDKTIKDFREQVGLKDYHAGYLQSLLATRVEWNDVVKKWIHSSQPGTTPPNAV